MVRDYPRAKKRRFRTFLVKVVLGFILINYMAKKIKLDENYLTYLTNNYFPAEKKEMEIATLPIYEQESFLPLVYIYNTHDGEKYDYNKLQPFNIDYDVKFAAYILASYLEEYGIKSVVEKESVVNLLKENSYAYYQSYSMSRTLLEKSVLTYPSLTYFIDLHRDAAPKDVVTQRIGDKDYAKVLFVIGQENENYEKNLEFASKLNARIEQVAPGLSRGITQKSGQGVNGVYNQDFNQNVILIEVGSEYSYIEEVNNTLKVLASVLYEYIMEDE